jgi:hypothetical protein
VLSPSVSRQDPTVRIEKALQLNAARCALPSKRVESSGYVIGFVISFRGLTCKVAHYQQLGGEGS